jgi:hypothetical protein
VTASNSIGSAQADSSQVGHVAGLTSGQVILRRYFDEGVADGRFNAPDTTVRVVLPEIAHDLDGLTALAHCASIAALDRRKRSRP